VRLRIASDCGRAVCLRLLLGFSRFSRAVSVDRLRSVQVALLEGFARSLEDFICNYRLGVF